MKIDKYLTAEAKTEYVITDMGQSTTARSTTMSIKIPRYGVWVMSGNTLKNVVETGDDLTKLQKKYNTTDVLKMGE